MDILGIYPQKANILLIGPIPPPFGGVSVHIKRLKFLIERNENRVDLFYTSKKYRLKILNSIKLAWIILNKNYDIIHIQGYFRTYMLVIFLLEFIKRYKIYFTDHNPRLFEKKGETAIFFIKKFIEKVDYLVLVAEHVLEGYNKNKVNLPQNILVQNAFLPPDLEEEKLIFETYSRKTKDFINQRKPLIIANGNKNIFYKNYDLYGLDLCIQLTEKLKKKFPNIGFIFVMSLDDKRNEYFVKMTNQIREKGIMNNFYIMIGQNEIWPLIKRSDLIIRPTMSDGDALTIREALYFKCQVIASNVVPRPEGTILFKSRDIEDLYAKTMQVLQSQNY